MLSSLLTAGRACPSGRLQPSARVLGALLVGFLTASPAARAANEPRFVPDVVAQFNALSERPDPLGFYRGESPDPTVFTHYQGMVRLQGADGTPYFLVSRCGVFAVSDNVPGNLLSLRLDSREKFGERLRSNRLERNRDLANTQPPLEDTTVSFITFNGGYWPNYSHPGGMQLWGDVLVVPLESPLDSSYPDKLVIFVDVADPEHPALLSSLDPRSLVSGVETGLVGITKLADGRFLMLLTGGSNDHLWFFETAAPDPLDLRSPSLTWQHVSTWSPNDGLGQEWPSGTIDGTHQTLQFIREGDINGALYLASARGTIAIGQDRMDLYRVEFIDGEYQLRYVSTVEADAHPNADKGLLFTSNTANFAAASTFYVSPSGELLFYATEHENDGPGPIIGYYSNNTPIIEHSIKAGEWRHRDMVRPDSPTLRPHLTLFPPYEVDEGGTTVLTGDARPPLTRAWVELYAGTDFSDRYVVMDHADWSKDDFDNFKNLDGSFADAHEGFDNEPSSWRWFAPEHCTIRVNDDNFGDDDFPGTYTRTLRGTGEPQADANLSSVPNDSNTGIVNDEATSAQFFPNCDEYYGTVPELFWDTDRNGAFETVGNIAPFDAANLDGPGVASARVLAIHPIDGLTTEDAAIVQILNKPPVITSFGVFDSDDHEVGVDVPFVLTNLPVTVRATFRDPGKPDHQAATLAWGDGAPDASAEFASFSDAFGGVVGSLAHSHAYPTGGAFPIQLVVRDDDGDASATDRAVEVLTPAEAVDAIIDLLDDTIDATTDRDQKRRLQSARKDLAGSTAGLGHNGAFDMLVKGNTNAALVKIRHAIAELTAARALGADVGPLIDLLRQVESSVLAG